MNCQEVMELMQRQLDDDLVESERDVLMNHTRQCPDCAAMFERLTLLSAELTSLPKVVPSYSLVDAIMPQLERIELYGQHEAAAEAPLMVGSTEIASRRTKPKRRWPSMRIMGGVIAAGVVAGLFLVTYNSGMGPSFSNASLFTADSTNSAADNSADAPQEMAYKMALPSEAEAEPEAAPEVSTETIDDMSRKSEATKEELPNNIFEQSETNFGESDTSTENAAPVSDADSIMEEEASANSSSSSQESSGGTLGVETTDKNKLGVAAVEPEPSSISPNGKYNALAEGYSVNIYATEDQSLVLQLERKNGQIANFIWSEDSTQLTYEVQVEQGAIEKYVVDLANGKEEKAAH